MQTNTLAAEVVARLGAEPGRSPAVDELATQCSASEEELAAACALLQRFGLIRLDERGHPALHPRGAASGSLVLVVENTPAVAHVVGALLESDGYPVLIATDLQTGLGVVKAAAVSLVIADSFASTAHQATERLAPLREAARPAPVLLFTAHRDLGDEGARDAGYAGLLPKPFDIDDLLDRVAEALRSTTH